MASKQAIRISKNPFLVDRYVDDLREYNNEFEIWDHRSDQILKFYIHHESDEEKQIIIYVPEIGITERILNCVACRKSDGRRSHSGTEFIFWCENTGDHVETNIHCDFGVRTSKTLPPYANNVAYFKQWFKHHAKICGVGLPDNF